MRKGFYLTTLILVLLPIIVIAQEPETLIDSDVRHGGFGAPVFGITSINGEVAYFRGTRGAWVINFEDTHTINLGLAGYRTATNFEPVNWAVDGVDNRKCGLITVDLKLNMLTDRIACITGVCRH
jgi:hypothetical protein